MTSIEMTISGMSCEHCVKAVTQAIRSRDPAAEVAIDLASGRLRATTTLPRDQVQAAVEEEGYGVAG